MPSCLSPNLLHYMQRNVQTDKVCCSGGTLFTKSLWSTPYIQVSMPVVLSAEGLIFSSWPPCIILAKWRCYTRMPVALPVLCSIAPKPWSRTFLGKAMHPVERAPVQVCAEPFWAMNCRPFPLYPLVSLLKQMGDIPSPRENLGAASLLPKCGWVQMTKGWLRWFFIVLSIWPEGRSLLSCLGPSSAEKKVQERSELKTPAEQE